MEKDERVTSVPNMNGQYPQYPCYPGAINVNPTIIVNVTSDTESHARTSRQHTSADADIANALMSGITGLFKLMSIY